jgi:hypothetical protein
MKCQKCGSEADSRGRSQCKKCWNAYMYEWNTTHRDKPRRIKKTAPKCPQCGEIDITKFDKNRSGQFGYQNYCRSCRAPMNAADWKICSDARRMLHGARGRAKKFGTPFNLEIQDIIVPTHCPVLGIELHRGEGRQTSASPSLDRIKPELGYVRGNVRVISNRANTLKNNASAAELRLVADDAERLEKPQS